MQFLVRIFFFSSVGHTLLWSGFFILWVGRCDKWHIGDISSPTMSSDLSSMSKLILETIRFCIMCVSSIVLLRVSAYDWSDNLVVCKFRRSFSVFLYLSIVLFYCLQVSSPTIFHTYVIAHGHYFHRIHKNHSNGSPFSKPLLSSILLSFLIFIVHFVKFPNLLLVRPLFMWFKVQTILLMSLIIEWGW